MTFKFRPIRGRIIVKPIEEPEMSSGGIFVSEEYRDLATRGEVVSVGRGNLNKAGIEVPIPIQVGDTIRFHKYAGQSFDLDNEKYLIMEADKVELLEDKEEANACNT